MSNVITARVDDKTFALVDAVARSRGRSRSWFVAEAVKRVAQAEADFDAFVQEGIDAIDRGDTVPHEVIMARLEARIGELKARCQD